MCIRDSLYDEQFQPVLDREEYRGFMTAYQDGKMSRDLNRHVEDLKWCSGLVLCYPTWWYSFPAILKVRDEGFQCIENVLLVLGIVGCVTRYPSAVLLLG